MVVSSSCLLPPFKLTADAAPSVVVLPLNANVPTSLSGSNAGVYQFTAPATGYYVVETFGTTDTYATYSGEGLTAYDDDSGEGVNFAIGFFLHANNTGTITVHLMFPTNQTEIFYISVRRQKARFYVYDYTTYMSNGFSTYGQATNPSYNMSTIGYYCETNYDKTINQMLLYDNNYQKINCDIFFISGHGSPGLFVDKSASPGYFNSNQIPSMANTKLALWNSCQSAVDDSPACISLAKKSYQAGAECAVGWTANFSHTSAYYWTNKFFQQLSLGKTIYQAGNLADDYLSWPYDDCKDHWVTFGNQNATIHTSAVYPKGSLSNDSSENMDAMLAKFNKDRKAFDYTEYPLKAGGTRYYKTVNGILTDDIYDVDNDGNIKKSEAEYSQDQLDQLSDFLTRCESVKYNKVDDLEDYERHILVAQISGIPTPIEMVSYCVNEGQFAYKVVECKNLYTNDSVDYSEICTISYQDT